MWDEQLRAFPLAVAVRSLYGLGDSIQEWASRVLEMVGPGQLAVVGSSIGASCALEMARIQPGRIAALVLVGAKASHHPEPVLKDRYISALRSRGLEGLWKELGPKYFPTISPPD